jgi:hypothetical protein
MESAKPGGGWKAAAASVRGRSHEQSGQSCQDAHAWERIAPDYLVAVVADGAGSATRADIGSAVAVRTALEGIRDQRKEFTAKASDGAWRRMLEAAMQIALEAVCAEAGRLGVHPRELATTLITLVAHPEVVAVAQIGDGASLLQDAEGHLIPLTLPFNTEYLNETTFLTSTGTIGGAQQAVWRGRVRNLAVMTDGLEMVALKLPEGLAHARFFQPLFRFLAESPPDLDLEKELADFLSSARVRERTEDDLTLLLGHFTPQSPHDSHPPEQ